MAIHLSALLTTSSAAIVSSSAVLKSQWSAMQRGVRAIVSESTATSIHLSALLSVPSAATVESSAGPEERNTRTAKSSETTFECSAMQTSRAALKTPHQLGTWQQPYFLRIVWNGSYRKYKCYNAIREATQGNPFNDIYTHLLAQTVTTS